MADGIVTLSAAKGAMFVMVPFDFAQGDNPSYLLRGLTEDLLEQR